MTSATSTREERLLIDGRLVPASDKGRFENVNPATEDVEEYLEIKTIAEAF